MSTQDNPYEFDWTDLAFASKKPLRDLKAVFIAAPREMSAKRFKQLVMQYLPQGNIVLGISKEDYVLGFEDQPQFRMLAQETVQKVIDQVNNVGKGRTIYTLTYFQRELPYVLEKGKFKHVVLVNGSWQHVFHNSPAYYFLVSTKTPYDMVSPFVDESEAAQYAIAKDIKNTNDLLKKYNSTFVTEKDMLHAANDVAKFSFDYSFQTGAVLAQKKGKDEYSLLAISCNEVVPYDTYAMHYGSVREKNFSPANDLNYYDTVHAEVDMLIQVQKRKLDLRGTTLFINLMPCPTCARMLSQTDIEEFVYTIDHSDGYAVKILEAAGKKVRRVVL